VHSPIYTEAKSTEALSGRHDRLWNEPQGLELVHRLMEYPQLPSPSPIRRIINGSFVLNEAPASQMVGASFRWSHHR